MDPSPGPIFISYSHANSAIAERFVDALHKSGVPFMIDRVLLEPGESLTAALGEAIDSAVAVVALISHESIGSTWVQRELAAVCARGTRVVPVRCDNAEWPSQLVLQLGDPLSIDARSIIDGVGRLPKAFVRIQEDIRGDLDLYFPLTTRPRAPRCRVIAGTLQSALEEVAFGRVMVLVPTDREVYLGGKVTDSMLDFLDLSAADLAPTPPSISPRETSSLSVLNYGSLELHLVAGTVFNRRGDLCAEDQHLAARAALRAAQQRDCALLLVPPMGTGAGGWPASSALRHWLFGAIQWATHTVVTEEAVWPVVCQPGMGAQGQMAGYLRGLDRTRLQELERGYLRFKVAYGGETRDTPALRYDTFIGSVVATAFPELTRARHLAVMSPDAVVARHDSAQAYPLDRLLPHTPFADGDTLRVTEG
jgi:hypothetical protein